MANLLTLNINGVEYQFVKHKIKAEVVHKSVTQSNPQSFEGIESWIRSQLSGLTTYGLHVGATGYEATDTMGNHYLGNFLIESPGIGGGLVYLLEVFRQLVWHCYLFLYYFHSRRSHRIILRSSLLVSRRLANGSY